MHNALVGRIISLLLVVSVLAAACVDGGAEVELPPIAVSSSSVSSTTLPAVSSSSTSDAPRLTTTTTVRTNLDTPQFKTRQRPDRLELPSPSPTGSDSPSWVYAVDVGTGEEVWRVETPFSHQPKLQSVGDLLLLSLRNTENEDLVAAIELDGTVRWESSTRWRLREPFYLATDRLVAVADMRDDNEETHVAVVAIGLADGDLQWTRPLNWWPERGHEGPVTGGSGRVYVAGGHGHVIALDPDSGKVAWRVKLDGLIVGDAPFHHDGSVYVGTSLGLVAIDARDGSHKWMADTNDRLIAAPNGFTQGNVVSWLESDADDSFTVAAFDAATGQVAWTQSSSQQYWVASDIVVGFPPGVRSDWPQGINVWSGGTGALIADAAVESDFNPIDVTIFGSKIYVATRAQPGTPGRLVAIEGSTGRVAWATRLRGTLGAPTVFENLILVGAEDPRHDDRGALHAVNASTGDREWRFDTPMEVLTTPIVVNGVVFVVSAEGIVRSFD